MRLLRQTGEKDDLLGTGLLRKKGKRWLSLFCLRSLGEKSRAENEKTGLGDNERQYHRAAGIYFIDLAF